MTRHKVIVLVALVAGMALLGGCGSSGPNDGPVAAPGGSFGSDANGVAFTGSVGCISCHESLAFSADAVAEYRGSKHLLHSTQISAAAPADCLRCHDPLGEGGLLEKFVPAANLPAGGLAAVGCENCHGAGGEHYGVGAIPKPLPGVAECGQCHSALPAGPVGHTPLFADKIVENYQSGAHADSTQNPAAFCARCHSDEGFRLYGAATAGMDASELATELTDDAPLASQSAIQCRTCHDGHTGTLRAAETLATEGGDSVVRYSQEFNLCTSCHQVFLTPVFGTDRYSYTLDATRLPFHGSASGPTVAGSRVIWDTHFKHLDPANAANVLIPGYNINAAAANACTACHDPHGATKFAQADAVTVATAWGASGHADYLGEPFSGEITQAACLRCHSGPQSGRFVQGVTTANLDPSGGAQVVSCVSCHDTAARDINGDFALGALRPLESVTFPSGAVRSLDGPSNLCMNCHQGRSSTPTVNQRIAAGNLAFSNIHYFAAAATLFGSEVQGGYEYAGRSYRGRNTFVDHAVLGRSDLTTCAGCHLGSTAEHSFQVNLATCTPCHPGTAFSNLAGSPQINNQRIVLLKDQLLGLLTASGVVALDGYPYFQNIATATQLRAAYNWQVADKEPCGYIHNGYYIRQLLYDSIVEMGGVPLVPNP